MAAKDTLRSRQASQPPTGKPASQEILSFPRSNKSQVSWNLCVMASVKVTPSIFPTSNTTSPSK